MCEIFPFLQRTYKKFHLSYAVPFLVLISYTLLGAAVFRNLELERDVNERELFMKSYYYAFDQITRRILELRCEDEVIRRDINLQRKYAEDAINWFLNFLNFTDVVRERNASSPWSWYGSMFYAGQLYTTIGYGLPVAKTLAGQIVSIFYIMFGIPIFLIILKDVGRLLSRSFRKFYKRLRSTRRASTVGLRQMSLTLKGLYNRGYVASTADDLCQIGHKKPKLDFDPELGTIIRKKTVDHENTFPIPIALAMLILWIVLSAALFCTYETEWGFLTSVYFFFVSISTVGLGDIVPGNKDMMLGYFILILIGLALLSMCINLIQVALERMLDQLLQQYIDEIERVAAIAKSEVDAQSETSPFEIGMASGLLTMPLKKHHKEMLSVPKKLKDWAAEKIATNMIASRFDESVGETDSDSDSLLSSPSLSHQGISREIRPMRHGDVIERLRTHVPAIRAVQALEKARFYTPNKNFQSMLFSKFVTSSKLERYVDQVNDWAPRKVNVFTQTDLLPRAMLASVEEELYPLGMNRTRGPDGYKYSGASTGYDAESIFSNAYNDMQFSEMISSVHSTDDSIPSMFESIRKGSQASSPSANHRKPSQRIPRRQTVRPFSMYEAPLALQEETSVVPVSPKENKSRLDFGACRRIRSLPINLCHSLSQPSSPTIQLPDDQNK